MLRKVFYTSVLVSDRDRALDFYTNVLGLEKRVENPTPDGPRFLTVGVRGDDFQLVLWPGTREPVDERDRHMITGMSVESRMRGNAHVRFGGRRGETDRPQDRQRAPRRPN